MGIVGLGLHRVAKFMWVLSEVIQQTNLMTKNITMCIVASAIRNVSIYVVATVIVHVALHNINSRRKLAYELHATQPSAIEFQPFIISITISRLQYICWCHSQYNSYSLSRQGSHERY